MLAPRKITGLALAQLALGLALSLPPSIPIPQLAAPEDYRERRNLRFPKATLLYAELPLSLALVSTVARGGLLSGALGGPSLDPRGTARLTVATYPEAWMAWEGVPGLSERKSLPHRMLSMQLPVTFRGQKLYQTAYALVDDDAVMLLLREGDGVPAKVANISSPTGRPLPEESEPPFVQAWRRGVRVLHGELVHGSEIPPNSTELRDVFDRPDLNHLGTSKATKSKLWLQRTTKVVNISAARRVQMRRLEMTDDPSEPIKGLFANQKPVRAWLLAADLEVEFSSHKDSPALPITADPKDFNRRYGGKGLFHEVKAHRSAGVHPKTYQNGQILWMEQRVNEAAVRRRLPEGFALDDPLALLWHARWEPALILAEPYVYNELWVALRVRYKGRPFHYPVLVLLDDDVAMMMGHDFMGAPAKLANITYRAVPGKKNPNDLVALLHVTRRGREVVRFVGKIGPPESRLVRGLNSPFETGYAWVHSAEFPREPDLHTPSYAFLRSYVKPREQFSMNASEVKFSWGRSEEEPLAELFANEPPRGAGYMVADMAWGPWADDRAEHARQGWASMGPGAAATTEAMPEEHYSEWWRTNYQMRYM